jgi:hypothetical protein
MQPDAHATQRHGCLPTEVDSSRRMFAQGLERSLRSSHRFPIISIGPGRTDSHYRMRQWESIYKARQLYHHITTLYYHRNTHPRPLNVLRIGRHQLRSYHQKTGSPPNLLSVSQIRLLVESGNVLSSVRARWNSSDIGGFYAVASASMMKWMDLYLLRKHSLIFTAIFT